MKPSKAVTGICYRVKNDVNGKSYIGSTVYFDHRKQCHLIALLKGTHHSPKLQNSWNKHGEANFVWEILETIENEAQLDPKEFAKVLLPREDFYIEYYDAVKNGYNVCPIAGTVLGVRRTQELKDFLRERRIAYIASNASYGEEHRQRMQDYYELHPEARDVMRDKKLEYHEANPQAAEEARTRAIKQFADPAARQAASEKAKDFYSSSQYIDQRNSLHDKIRQQLLNGGKVREIAAMLRTSANTIKPIRDQLIAEGLLSNEVSEATRAKMRKPKSDEAKARMSAAQTGHEVSDDAREKIRQKTIEQFSDPAARQAAADKTIAFFNSPEQVAKRELRDAPILEMLMAGYKQTDIIQKLHVSSATITKVKNSLAA